MASSVLIVFEATAGGRITMTDHNGCVEITDSQRDYITLAPDDAATVIHTLADWLARQCSTDDE